MKFTKYEIWFAPEVCFISTNSVDPDEMPHFAAFNLCFHCQSNCLGLKFDNCSITAVLGLALVCDAFL